MVDYPPGTRSVEVNTNNKELAKRLKKIYEELTNVEEESDESLRYKSLLEHLIQPGFLKNSNSAVRIHLAFCIAELLRIFAPNCPVDDSEHLKDVLLFMIDGLRGLSDVKADNYQRHLNLLENLAKVESLQLALGLGDEAKTILRNLIKVACEVVSGDKDVDGRLHSLFIIICSKLLQEVDLIDTIVLDVFFHYLVEPQKSNNRRSYQLVRELISLNQSSFEPFIKMIFLQFLEQGCRDGEFDGCNLTTHIKLYEIIYELHEFVPDIVYPIISLLVAKLKSPDASVRLDTTKLFGLFFCSKNSKLAEEVPDAWEEFRNRYSDISDDIRSFCVSCSGNIICNNYSLRGEVAELVIARSKDLSEQVRLAYVNMIYSLSKSKFDAISEQMLQSSINRLMDIKEKVRHAATRTLSLIFRSVSCNQEFGESERASVLIIFAAILKLYLHPAIEDRVYIEKNFVSNLIPYKVEVSKRVELLIKGFQSLDCVGMRCFEQILQNQCQMRMILAQILDLLPQASQDEVKKSLVDRVNKLAEFQHDSIKWTTSFKHLLNLFSQNPRILRLLKFIVSGNHPSAKIEAYVFDILNITRAELSKEMEKECFPILLTLFERCAPLQIDSEFVDILIEEVSGIIENVTSSSAQTSSPASFLKLIRIIAEKYDHCFVSKKTFQSLLNALQHNDLSIVADVIVILNIICANLKKNDDLADLVPSVLKHCEKLAYSKNPRAAKYAVRTIVEISTPEDAQTKLNEIVENVLPFLDNPGESYCAALKVLGVCVQSFPDLFKARFSELIKTKIVENVLSSDSAETEAEKSSVDGDDETSESFYFHNDDPADTADLEISNLGENYVSKMYGLKFMKEFLCAIAPTLDESHEGLARHILQLLFTFVETQGKMFEKRVRKRCSTCLLYTAGLCILKMATVSNLNKFLSTKQFVLLGVLVQSEVDFVGREIVSRITKYLNSLKLSVRYFSLIPLFLLNKDDNVKQKFRLLIESHISLRRRFISRLTTPEFVPYYQPEYSLAYLIYLLSKQPQFTSNLDYAVLSSFREILWFLIEIFVKEKEPGSLELLYNMLQCLKNSSDAGIIDQSPDDQLAQNKKLWALCDLGMTLLSYRVKFIIRNANRKVLLSTRFFTHDASKNNLSIYVPDKLIEEEKKGFSHASRTKPATEDQTSIFASSSLAASSHKRAIKKTGAPGSKRLIKSSKIPKSNHKSKKEPRQVVAKKSPGEDRTDVATSSGSQRMEKLKKGNIAPPKDEKKEVSSGTSPKIGKKSLRDVTPLPTPEKKRRKDSISDYFKNDEMKNLSDSVSQLSPIRPVKGRLGKSIRSLLPSSSTPIPKPNKSSSQRLLSDRVSNAESKPIPSVKRRSKLVTLKEKTMEPEGRQLRKRFIAIQDAK